MGLWWGSGVVVMVLLRVLGACYGVAGVARGCSVLLWGLLGVARGARGCSGLLVFASVCYGLLGGGLLGLHRLARVC